MFGRVRRDRRDPELVELAQLFTGGQRGAGHPAHRRVPVDQRLHGDGVEHFAGLGGLDAFLGLDRGLQAVGPALQLGDPAAGGVDQVHGAVADDVVHVALQQHMGVQGDVDLGQRGATCSSEYRSMPPRAFSTFCAPTSVRWTLRRSESVS